MSNKFEKRSGFEHVNIKTSQTPDSCEINP